MHDRFVSLCEIPSPSGQEREVADAVISELSAVGMEVAEDDTATETGAGSGNLLARMAGSGEDSIFFAAHLDTVPHSEPVSVALEDGVYRSRGDTILGADNKAAVTVLVELAERHRAAGSPVGLELLLTASEEVGLVGAHAFDPAGLASTVGFVLDHASPIGEVITESPTHQRLTATFTGVEAHAGLRPEDGSSAIAAAAAAIAAMQLGRLDAESTANVGLIGGGTAPNVVPGRCSLEAEARSLDPAKAAEAIGEMSDACAWGASEHGCDLDTKVAEVFRGYRVPSGSEALGLAEAGLRRAGLEPVRVPTGGGSDANALMAKGVDCVLLANGTSANHTPAEAVEAHNLDVMLEVCEAILAEAARC